MPIKSIFLVVVLFLCSVSIVADNLVCTDEFCRRYSEDPGCPIMAMPCRIQNSTINGRLFPAPVPCNCCETCIENFALDEDCTIGSPGAPVPHGMCGAGLTCSDREEDEHTTCQMMSGTDCLDDQSSFDMERNNGSIGHLMQRSHCDDDGEYSPIKCIPGQICYCVNREGKRIFGEALNIRGIEVLMKCGCSRAEEFLGTVLETDMRVPFVRCTESGSYDQLQCIKDQCLCVDSHSGFATSSTVNITTQGLQTLPCFNQSGYSNDAFHRECERKKSIFVTTLHDLARRGSFSLNENETLEMCQPDGYYARIQRNETHKFCADKLGKQIANYGAILGTTEADTMTCNCARVELLLKENKAFEIPSCCPNGNYQKISCRRGLCYCTDENGNQISLEVPHEDMNILECYDGNFC